MFGFNDPFENHINSIMNGFMMDPFGNRRPQRQSNNNRSSNNNQSLMTRDPFFDSMMPFDNNRSNPFALMNQMMNSMMTQNNGLFRNFDTIHADPNAQVYSSSSMVTYSNSGNGQPRVFQSSTSTHQMPGGIKETRQMVRDTSKGIEKASITHQIGDRAHTIERKKEGGNSVEEIVNLENLDEEELNEFNKEFEQRTRGAAQRRSHHHPAHPYHHIGHHQNQPFAIEDGSRNRERDNRKSKSKSKH
jgi:myeloid leukemia factor 1